MSSAQSLLRRQLKRFFGAHFVVPPEWQGFIDAVDSAYGEFEADLKLIERALEISSQELRETNSQMQAVFQVLPDLVFRLDSRGIILGLNGGAGEVLPPELQHCTGKRIQDCWVTSAPEKWNEALRRLRETRSAETFEISAGQEGQEIVHELRLVPLLQDQIVAIARNITERMRIQVQVEKAQKAAEAGNRAKSEFLANMSHEIRTPMNGVLGMAELLLDTELDTNQRDCAETIRDSGKALLTVINDILDFSKIEAGKLEFENIDMDLREIVEDTCRVLALQAHAKGIEITLDIDARIPNLVQGDPGRVRQVLLNLGGNGVKFTEKGEVAIELRVLASDATGTKIYCEVRDTGPGIPADRVEALFQPFTQVDSSTSRKFGGTGLGLSIARRLVELMRGEAGVQSELGVGSRFWFTAHFAQAAASDYQPRRLAPAALAGRRVLAVDDNATNLKVLCGQVARCELSVDSASSAAQALDLMRQAWDAGRPYEVVLLDHDMPGCNGEELGRRINADPEFKATRLVLLTSSGMRGDGPHFARLGFAGYLLKPVGQRDLVDCLLVVLGANAEDWHTHVQPMVTHHKLRTLRARHDRKHVLIAEDNVVNQKVARRLLETLGYMVSVVENGRDAVAAWEGSSFDLILMDCQMPELDGYEATREIRKRERTGSHIPIVALTAHAMAGADIECKAAGMDDHLSKPIDRKRLGNCLERFLGTPTSAST